jgi:signal transduction histidine kinase
MTDSDTTLSLEAYPDPALAYDCTDEPATVQAVNEPFREVFSEPESDTPVGAVLGRFRTADAIVDDVLEALDSSQRRDIRLRITAPVPEPDEQAVKHGADAEVTAPDDGTAGEYLVRVVPAEDDRGHLLFVDCDALETATGSDGSDRLTSVLTHDFRNLLDVADANLYAARIDGDEKCFDQVESAHDRMERLLDDVLTLARGAEPIDPSTTVDLGTLVDRAWETVAPTDGTLVVDDPLPEARADPDHVSRLIENLIRNAVDHGHESTTVHVGPVPEEDGGGFYIADDGPGIPAADRERVFERGYTDRDGGTGLGLAIVSRIAAAHGWQVDLTTSDDGGARFEIVFESQTTGADPTDTS